MLPGIQQFDLSGRSAIITGGSKGLGAAIAAGLASAGADVMLASRNLDEATATADTIASDFGHKAVACKADVTSESDVKELVSRTITAFGKIDILVNNAGINIRGSIDELTLDTRGCHPRRLSELLVLSGTVVRARVERAMSPQDKPTTCSPKNNGSRGAPRWLYRLFLQHR